MITRVLSETENWTFWEVTYDLGKLVFGEAPPVRGNIMCLWNCACNEEETVISLHIRKRSGRFSKYSDVFEKFTNFYEIVIQVRIMFWFLKWKIISYDNGNRRTGQIDPYDQDTIINTSRAIYCSGAHVVKGYTLIIRSILTCFAKFPRLNDIVSQVRCKAPPVVMEKESLMFDIKNYITL